MRAIKNNVIVKPHNHFTLPSGIIISAKELENPSGVVVSAGEGTKRNPMTVKDGDRVTYLHNVGQALEHEGENFLVLNEVHIIGIE
jgi:chaperonin GroES